MLNRRLKIFDYTWHIPHQSDMIYALKDHCEFYYGITTKRHWDSSVRPIPINLNFVTHYEPGLYDLAILHLDQQCTVRESTKRLIYNQYNEVINDIPKIVINHGTPVYPERLYQTGNMDINENEAERTCVEDIRELIGRNIMVVNSHASASEAEWGFGIPIVHGINSDDWWDLPKEPRVFTALSPSGLEHYYNRRCMFDVSDELHDNYGYMLYYAKLNVETDRSPEDYKTFLGKSLLYLDTSVRTPMNRARTEAFLSGCCVIQVEGAHDLERWAKDGENIILVPNEPYKIAALIKDILENRYEEAIAIGKRGKEMAIKNFDPERYKQDWLKLFNKIL